MCQPGWEGEDEVGNGDPGDLGEAGRRGSSEHGGRVLMRGCTNRIVTVGFFIQLHLGSQDFCLLLGVHS